MTKQLTVVFAFISVVTKYYSCFYPATLAMTNTFKTKRDRCIECQVEIQHDVFQDK